MSNSTNKNNSYTNYDSRIHKNENTSFNNAFRIEKGISFKNYCNLTSALINNSTEKNIVKSKIHIDIIDRI